METIITIGISMILLGAMMYWNISLKGDNTDLEEEIGACLWYETYLDGRYLSIKNKLKSQKEKYEKDIDGLHYIIKQERQRDVIEVIQEARKVRGLLKIANKIGISTTSLNRLANGIPVTERIYNKLKKGLEI